MRQHCSGKPSRATKCKVVALHPKDKSTIITGKKTKAALLCRVCKRDLQRDSRFCVSRDVHKALVAGK